MIKLKKSISIITSVATMVTMTGAGVLLPMAAGAQTIVDGDLIQNSSAEEPASFDIYIVKISGDDMYKRLILSPHVFESYEHFDKNGNGDNWDDVIDVDASVMGQYITSDLVRPVGQDKVYRLYAADGTDTGNKYWLDMEATDFDTEFKGNMIYEINDTDSAGYTAGANVTDPSATFPPEGGEIPDESIGTLTCSLAADTPASGMAVQSAARLPFAKVNCTATGGDVIVDKMVIERAGLGQDGAFSSLDIIDAGSNMPINVTSKTLNSLHRATFTDDITVSNGTTKSLILGANMASSLSSYAGEAPALSLVEMTLKGDATLNASLPITGNTQTINATISIGTVTVDTGTYSNATSTTIQVGKENYTFLAFSVQAGSAEKVSFSQVKIYQQGSATLGTDIVDLKLYQDATELADCEVISSKYATCGFDTITLDKGAIGQYKVQADVEDGSARTVILGIYKATDLLVTGETYGYNITPTYKEGGAAAGTGSPVFNDAQFTISNGTLNVTKSNEVGSDNIAITTDQLLGSFEFEVKGEAINITALTLTITSSTSATSRITGVELVDPDGFVVAGPTDPGAGTSPTVAWTDTFTAPVGKTIYKVRADLPTNGGWASSDTLKVGFTPSAMTATGEVTGNAPTITPSSVVNGNTQTVKGSSLVVSRRSMPADKTIVVGQSDLLLASWDFDATASGEDIRITTMGFTAASGTMAATNTSALTIYVDDVAQSPVNDAIATNASAAKSSTFAFDESIIITKGTKVKIDLKGNKTTVASNDTEQWGIMGNSITATSVATGQAVVESITADAGPTITSRAMGMMTIDVDSKPSSAIVVSGSSDNTFVGVAFTALYEDMRLDQLIVNIGDGGYEFSSTTNYADINEVCLYNDGDYLTGDASGSCSSIPSGGTRTFDIASDVLTVPQSRSEVITIKASMPTITSSINAPSYSSADMKLGFGGTDGIKFTGMSSNSTITGSGYEVYNDSTSSYQVLYKSKPTVTIASSADSLGADTTLTDGVRAIFAYKVSADSDGGDVLLYRNTFVFTTSSGSGIKLTNCYLKYSGDGYAAKIKANETPAELNDTVGVNVSWLDATFNNPDFDITGATTDEAIKINSGDSETFRLYCSVSGASASGENVSTMLIGDTASTSANVGYDNCANNATTNCSAGWVAATVDFSNAIQANFVWSDNWKNKSLSASGQTNATSSPMWYNGYLVPGLEKSITTTSYVLSY